MKKAHTCTQTPRTPQRKKYENKPNHDEQKQSD